MKTLQNNADLQEVRSRLTALTPQSQRRWGNMSVSQMLCHLTDSFRLTTGEKGGSQTGVWFQRNVIKHVALRLPIPWPKGVPTRPEMDQQLGGTKPQEFQKDRQLLLVYLDRFCKQPRQYTPPPHPIFGTMTDWEWDRWAYLHLDHHLRQFGL